MDKVKVCEYNWDDGTLDIIFKDNSKIRIDCLKIEEELHTTLITGSKLEYLLDNDPISYANLILSGKIQEFIDDYEKSYYEQKKIIRQQLEKKYDKDTAENIASEMMMYGDLF